MANDRYNGMHGDHRAEPAGNLTRGTLLSHSRAPLLSHFIRIAMAAEFPPAMLSQLAGEIAGLLKEKKETVSVAETVRAPLACLLSFELHH